MPLLKGKSNIGRNIRELTEYGSKPRNPNQILAIALHTAYGNQKGGLKAMARGKKRK